MMKKTALIALCSALLIPLETAAALPAAVDEQPLPSLAPVLERVTPSVVNIYTQTRVRINSPLINDPFFRRFFNIPERIHVFQFCPGAEFFRSQQSDTYISVAAHASLFHVTVTNLKITD